MSFKHVFMGTNIPVEVTSDSNNKKIALLKHTIHHYLLLVVREQTEYPFEIVRTWHPEAKKYEKKTVWYPKLGDNNPGILVQFTSDKFD